MPISLVAITSEQAEAILHYEEGHFCDLKSRRERPSALTEYISAFANADGGELLVGIEESLKLKRRSWRGFKNQEAANGHIQLLGDLYPLGVDYSYSFLRCETKRGLVLKVEIQKTRSICKSSRGLIFVRRGAQNLPVNTREGVRQLEYAKGISSFETESVNCSADVITDSEPTREFMSRVIPQAEPRAWLEKQQLVRDERPTVAGVLLFAEEPQALLPKHCGIKVYRYRTKDQVGTRESMAFDPITVEGHLCKQIRRAVERTAAIIHEGVHLGDAGVEAVSYPPETLHEIITNAVIHRDYSYPDDIHIRIFDNRVEVQSPGPLPAHITPANILKQRASRNGFIVRLLNKFPMPPNKDVGEGLATAFAAMHKMGLRSPEITSHENHVLVQIRHERLASPEKTILDHLKTRSSICNREAREICHIAGDYVVKEIFGRLVTRGLIERVPGTKTGGTRYRQGPKFNQGDTSGPLPDTREVPPGAQTEIHGLEKEVKRPTRTRRIPIT
jgi:ATP-dependent DNA helicase RecG